MMSVRFPVSVWIVALALAVVTSLPYAIGWLGTPEGMAYSGGPALPTGLQWDYNSRMGMLGQGARHDWDFHLLFTPEPHDGIYLVQGFYVAAGALADVFGLGIPLAFHVLRFAVTIVMVLALWAFAERFFSRTEDRWLCLSLATVASGWSWLLLLVAPGMTQSVSPIEFWLIDAYNLMGAFYAPHFAASVATQIAVLLVLETWIEHGGVRRLGWLTFLLAVESIIQPYSIALLGTLVGLLALYHIYITRRLTWRRALGLALPGGVYAGLVLYQYLSMQADPVWSRFVEQNQTRSPTLVYYILGYAPFLLPIAAGLRAAFPARQDDRWLAPLLWVMIVAVLLYAPVMTQRRYLLGVQTPLAVLATQGWAQGVLPHVKQTRRPLATIAYVSLASIASWLMIVANANAIPSSRYRDALYYTADERAGLAWLRNHTPPDSVVLTVATRDHHGSGGRVVAQTRRRVFVGHFIETADFDRKVELVKRFYDPATSDAWRRDLLAEYNIEVVWYDRYAQELGAWNPVDATYLEPAFTSETVTIFRRKE